MTPLVRRFLKTAIAFLFGGLAVGLWLSAWLHLGFLPDRYPSVAAHTHLLLVGFVVMTIMGVALWMFPRPASDDARYRPERMELVYWILALAVPVRTTAEILSGWSPARAWHIAVFAASAAQVVAIVLFFVNLLPRIRSSREDRERGRKAPAALVETRRDQ
jgi:cbb3-type cytochrome oxidase subunit 1